MATTLRSSLRRLQQSKQYNPGRNAYSSSSSSSPPSQHAFDNRASSKLLADAALEESPESSSSTPSSSSRTAQLLAQHQEKTGENWDGEERIQDAVLRMLVDKYRPLRLAGGVRSADEKLKAAPPTVLGSSTNTIPTGDRYETISELGASMAGVEAHKPWLVTFKPPSHTTSVKLGRIASPSSSHRNDPTSSDGEGKVQDPFARRRSENAQRLGRAKESLLDYKLGIRGSGTSSSEENATSSTTNQRRPPMPVSLRGISGLVEEKIERARKEGHFRTIKGRGKPLQRETAESNPFIPREEFLMNRIVQRNGAAPPWVDLQNELEESITSFRRTLLQSWTRRAVRMLTLSRPPSQLLSLSLSECKALRDPEWEARERAYHDAALGEVNATVRRYNGVAPYPIRRPFYDRRGELERVYASGAEEMLRAIRKRVAEGNVVSSAAASDMYEGGEDGLGTRTLARGHLAAGTNERQTGIWQAIRSWFVHLRA